MATTHQRDRPRRYAPLLAYLAALPAEQPVITLPFAAFEALLGRPLALTTQVIASYWSGGAIAQRNWLAAGWTAQLNRRAQTVTFTREEA